MTDWVLYGVYMPEMIAPATGNRLADALNGAGSSMFTPSISTEDTKSITYKKLDPWTPNLKDKLLRMVELRGSYAMEFKAI